jgi:hypothetical protein
LNAVHAVQDSKGDGVGGKGGVCLGSIGPDRPVEDDGVKQGHILAKLCQEMWMGREDSLSPFAQDAESRHSGVALGGDKDVVLREGGEDSGVRSKDLLWGDLTSEGEDEVGGIISTPVA